MSKKKLILFVACLVVLLGLQIKVILPFVRDFAASDAFLVESKDDASPLPVSNDMTVLAFANCNTFIKNDLGEDKTATFANQPTNVWTLGNYEYIVNADVEISGKDTASAVHHYVCRIQYANGDDASGIADIENWKIGGVSGLTD